MFAVFADVLLTSEASRLSGAGVAATSAFADRLLRQGCATQSIESAVSHQELQQQRKQSADRVFDPHSGRRWGQGARETLAPVPEHHTANGDVTANGRSAHADEAGAMVLAGDAADGEWKGNKQTSFNALIAGAIWELLQRVRSTPCWR